MVVVASVPMETHAVARAITGRLNHVAQNAAEDKAAEPLHQRCERAEVDRLAVSRTVGLERIRPVTTPYALVTRRRARREDELVAVEAGADDGGHVGKSSMSR